MATDKAALERGRAYRAKVMGQAYADDFGKAADSFMAPFEDLATAVPWGSVWSRDGLPLKTRSLIVLAMLTVLDCPEQIRLHVGGALRNGCSEDEIREVFLQAAAYAGFPKAHRAIQAAFEVVAAFRKSPEGDARP
jgi:4-carboxymuconolactone decarboxylase